MLKQQVPILNTVVLNTIRCEPLHPCCLFSQHALLSVFFLILLNVSVFLKCSLPSLLHWSAVSWAQQGLVLSGFNQKAHTDHRGLIKEHRQKTCRETTRHINMLNEFKLQTSKIITRIHANHQTY